MMDYYSLKILFVFGFIASLCLIKCDNMIPGLSICGLETPIPGNKTPEYKTGEGYPAHLGQFPWTASLIYEFRSEPKIGCSAFLINNRHLLTAARCVNNAMIPNLKYVLLGEYDRSTELDCANEVCGPKAFKAEIEEYVIHESFVRQPEIYNIALIRLTKDVKFSHFISPICLPSVVNDYQESVLGEEIFVSGLASDNIYTDPKPEKMIFCPSLVRSDSCEVQSKTPFNLTEVNICVNAERIICRGFEGSAMMVKIGNNWLASGIVTKANYCTSKLDPTVPAVGLKLSFHDKWIKDNLKA